MWFDRWSDVARVLTLGATAYAAMVVTLRASGKRTLSKLNAFDLVVTVALGSVLATMALSSEVSFVDGFAAIVVLIAAQWLVAWISVHVPPARRMVRSQATTVFIRGSFDDAALENVRLTRDEIYQAIRSSGQGDLEGVAAVVLENDGSLSVVSVENCRTASALPSWSAVNGGAGEPLPPDRP